MNSLEKLQKQNQELRKMLKEALAINKDFQKPKRRARVMVQRPPAKAINEQKADATKEQKADATKEQDAKAINEQKAKAINEQKADATKEQDAKAINEQKADATKEQNAKAINEQKADATKEQDAKAINEQDANATKEQSAKPAKELRAAYIKSGFVAYLKHERRLSANTVNSYKWDLKKVKEYLLKTDKPPLHKTTADDLRAFLNEKGKDYSHATQARIIACLRSFFKYMRRNGIRNDNPVDLIDTPKRAQVLHTILTPEEVTDLFKSITKKERQGLRNIAVLRMLYGCGLRVSELLTIKLNDVFLKENRIKITGKGNKQRFVPITKATKKALKNYIEKERANQFIHRDYKECLILNNRGRNMTRMGIGAIIDKSVKKTGIKKQVTPHTFRHSFATHLLEQGANINAIQKIMGHSTIASTEVYLKIQDGFVQEQINKHHLHG